MSRLKKYLEEIDTASAGGTDGSCATPETNGLRNLKVDRRIKKKKKEYSEEEEEEENE